MSIFGDLIAKCEGRVVQTNEALVDNLNNIGKIAYNLVMFNKVPSSSDTNLANQCLKAPVHYESGDKLQIATDEEVKKQASILLDLVFILDANKSIIESIDTLKTPLYGHKDGLIIKFNKTFSTANEFKSAFKGNREYVSYTENGNNLIDGVIIPGSLIEKFDTFAAIRRKFRF